MEIIKDITNEQYRARAGWSKSDLDLLSKSPCLLEWSKLAPKAGSPGVDLGTHLHCNILEPARFASQYIAAPEFNRRTTAGKEEAAAFFEEQKEAGKIVLDSDVAATLRDMRSSIFAHPAARELLQEREGESEVSVFSELYGVRVKCRPDRLLKGPVIVDLKKTADIETFLKSARIFRYEVQAAFYSDILQPYYGGMPDFYFVVVGEKRQIGRHPVRVFKLSQATLARGRETYKRDLEAARDFEIFGAAYHCAEEIDF